MLSISNVLEMIEDEGEDRVKQVLSSFISDNYGVEQFIKNNAIEFAKKKWSITYLVSDSETKALLGIFTLAVKGVQINPSMNMSNKMSRKIREFSLDKNNNSSKTTSTAFLLAQFSKNAKCKNKITGDDLMEEALKALKNVQTRVGGKLLWLECEEDNINALNFYQHDNYGFRKFNTRHDTESNITYIQMIKII